MQDRHTLRRGTHVCVPYLLQEPRPYIRVGPMWASAPTDHPPYKAVYNSPIHTALQYFCTENRETPYAQKDAIDVTKAARIGRPSRNSKV